MTRIRRMTLWGTTALCAAAWAGMPVAQELAQETAQSNAADLGTIKLSFSKRDVRTDTATAVTEIDATEIEDRQAGSVAELIDSVPGVHLVNGATSHGSGINIRGFGANSSFGTDNKVLIQVDGVTRGSEELYRIGNQLFTDPALYREVEVIRGTVGSFEYGSGVVGGVVRMETKNASDFDLGDKGWMFRSLYEFQTNGKGNTLSGTLAWQPAERAEFLLNFTNRGLGVQEDGNGNPINAAAGGIDDPSYLVKGKLHFGQDDAHSVTASYTSTKASEYDVPYDSFSGAGAFGSTVPPGTDNVNRKVSSETAMLRYGYNPVGNDLVDLTAQLSYADEQIDQTAVNDFATMSAQISAANPFLPPAAVAGLAGALTGLANADHHYETTTVTLKNRAHFDTGALTHNLVAGMEYIHRKRLNASSAPGGDDHRWAMFAVDEISLADALTVTPAIRYESSKIEGNPAIAGEPFEKDALMGGLSVRYAFQSGFSVFGSAAYTEVLPPIDDLDNIARIEQSEKALSYEIGAGYEKSGAFRAGDRLSFKANLYDTTLRDVTSYVGDIDPDPAVTDSRELHSVHMQGLEMEASYAMESGFYVDLNADISLKAEQTNAVLVSSDWRSKAADSLRLTLGHKFADTYDLSWETVANDAVTVNGARNSGFVIHNLRATIAPKTGVWEGTEFRVGVENLFDEQYQTALATRPAVGRNFKFSLAKTF